MIKLLRYILFPFAVLYSLVLKLRNFLYDRNILRSMAFDFPVICIGNLSTGGTGKTPMTEYLVRLLKERTQIAVISRGYKRRTKGFVLADGGATAEKIGDEPFQIFKKFGDITVAVSKDRLVAIPTVLDMKPQTGVILLDDAFQYRLVKAGMNILLTSFGKLYTDDFILPTGNLRDNRASASRADLIVVTRCKPDLSMAGAEAIEKRLNPLPQQRLFFATMENSSLQGWNRGDKIRDLRQTGVLLVAGIADPELLISKFSGEAGEFISLLFADHHHFTFHDITRIKNALARMRQADKIIITTEKDATRMEKYRKELEELPVYVSAARHSFLFDGEKEFEKQVLDYVDQFPGVSTL